MPQDDTTLDCGEACDVAINWALHCNGAVNWVLAIGWELLCNVADDSEVCNVAVGTLTLGSVARKWSLGKEVATGFCHNSSMGLVLSRANLCFEGGL